MFKWSKSQCPSDPGACLSPHLDRKFQHLTLKFPSLLVKFGMFETTHLGSQARRWSFLRAGHHLGDAQVLFSRESKGDLMDMFWVSKSWGYPKVDSFPYVLGSRHCIWSVVTHHHPSNIGNPFNQRINPYCWIDHSPIWSIFMAMESNSWPWHIWVCLEMGYTPEIAIKTQR